MNNMKVFLILLACAVCVAAGVFATRWVANKTNWFRRKRNELKKSAAELAHSTADRITEEVQEAAKKVD
jgi:HAMP domain-containing protein